ncbi:unnamed protein product, partial [marine sediment metagenome]
DDVERIEPLPDIDFNIRSGNTLVGYVNQEEIEKAKATQLDLSGAMKGIEERIENADRALQAFRDLQTRLSIPASELSLWANSSWWGKNNPPFRYGTLPNNWFISGERSVSSLAKPSKKRRTRNF